MTTKPSAATAAPEVAHHFESREQQFRAAKLGMWIFLTTEVLFFSGLFCFYAIYRAQHPDVFSWGRAQLDVTLGAINTAVLILSSLTAAWSVRCAQLGQRAGLVATLAVTLLCAFGFLGIKAVEYHHKWEHGLLPGALFDPSGGEHAEFEAGEAAAAEAPPAAAGEQLAHAPESAGGAPAAAAHAPPPAGAHVFFGVYFSLTGLHGVHVLIGIGLFAWLLVRAARGRFGPANFTAIDLGALYWHLVDLVWIFLFPLLYLVG